MCMYHVHAGTAEARRGSQITWGWSYRGLRGGGGQGKNAHDRRTSQVRLCQAHGTETGGHCHRKRLKTVLVVTDFVFNLLI